MLNGQKYEDWLKSRGDDGENELTPVGGNPTPCPDYSRSLRPLYMDLGYR